MAMRLEFHEYRPRKIVNVHKHVDGPWFWGKYTAHPYVGCRSGCEFCYARGERYLRRDPATFDTLIGVKVNAVDLLREELPKLARQSGIDVISVGDWQRPAEDRYRLSRGMLEVVRDLGFPLFITERSPLLTRDLDLLTDINTRAWVGVTISMGSVDPALKRAFEPRSPGVRLRLRAIRDLADAGIRVGANLMPVLPFVGDDEAHLEDVVRAVKDHGGAFVLGGGLTMGGVQAQRTLEAFRLFDPALEARVRELYAWKTGGKPQYGPPGPYNARLGLLVRELCARHSILDRMPRYIAPGPLVLNKRIAERLFLKTYDLELEQAKEYRLWAYRKAAWTVDELGESIGDIYAARGEAGLQALPGIGKSIAAQIAEWLAAENDDGE
ncbi:MAG: radical SAM protein [Anaerolineae bacterium]|nr:radical SAM protein [Anaerolineae bacterium]